MADLARRKAPVTTRRQPTRNRDTLLPPTRDTRQPDLEVNAPIERPDDSGAYELRRVLGLVSDTANSVYQFANERHLRREQQRGAQAQADFQTGQMNEELAARSEAYRNSYHVEQAKSDAYRYEREFSAATEELLNGDTVPDLEDIAHLGDQVARRLFQDDQGRLNVAYAETPAAARTLAGAMDEVRHRILLEAQGHIRDRVQADFLRTRGTNYYLDYVAQAQRAGTDANGPDALATPQGSAEGDQASPASASPPAPAAAAREAAPAARPTMGPRFRPVNGTVTSPFGSSRGGSRSHNGVDIDARMGDPVRIPARGRVIAVVPAERGGASGAHIIVDHGNGVQSSYSHLSGFNVHEGDVVNAGDVIGRVGNTGHVQSAGGGDGSHLHWVVRVGGRAVNPLTYQFPHDSGTQFADNERTQENGTGAQLSGTTPEIATGHLPTFNFEDMMRDLPPGIDRGTAKRTMLAAVIAAANDAGDYRVMDQLVQSRRADGTPSFNIEEIGLIQSTRDSIRERNRVEAQRARDARYDQNAATLIDSIVHSGQMPSYQEIANARDRDQISPSFAYSLFNAREADERQEAAQARSEAREAQDRADYELDQEIAAQAELRRAGVVADADRESDERRLRNGEFGTGRRAIMRFNRMRAAATEGIRVATQTPQALEYAAHLRQEFSVPVGTNNSLVAQAITGGQRPVNPLPAVLAEYNRLLGTGMLPHQAYAGAQEYARRTFGNNNNGANDPLAAARRRAAELRARQ